MIDPMLMHHNSTDMTGWCGRCGERWPCSTEEAWTDLEESRAREASLALEVAALRAALQADHDAREAFVAALNTPGGKGSHAAGLAMDRASEQIDAILSRPGNAHGAELLEALNMAVEAVGFLLERFDPEEDPGPNIRNDHKYWRSLLAGPASADAREGG